MSPHDYVNIWHDMQQCCIKQIHSQNMQWVNSFFQACASAASRRVLQDGQPQAESDQAVHDLLRTFCQHHNALPVDNAGKQAAGTEQTALEPALQSKLEPVPEDTVFEPKPTLQNGLSDVEQTGALPKKRTREEARLFSKSKVGEWIAAGGGKAPEQTELDTTFRREATPPVFELSGGQEKKRARTHRADEAIDTYKTRHKTDATAPP